MTKEQLELEKLTLKQLVNEMIMVRAALINVDASLVTIAERVAELVGKK